MLSFIGCTRIPRHLILLAAALLAPSVALAALGEPAASIAADRRALVARPQGKANFGSYSVEEAASGSYTIREYVSPSGLVFAVSWSGLAHPDLTPLLGAYAPEYQAAVQQTPRIPGRRQAQVRTDRVVVERWGHMRDLHGRAYVPALVPQGVKIDELGQ